MINFHQVCLVKCLIFQILAFATDQTFACFEIYTFAAAQFFVNKGA